MIGCTVVSDSTPLPCLLGRRRQESQAELAQVRACDSVAVDDADASLSRVCWGSAIAAASKERDNCSGSRKRRLDDRKAREREHPPPCKQQRSVSALGKGSSARSGATSNVSHDNQSWSSWQKLPEKLVQSCKFMQRHVDAAQRLMLGAGAGVKSVPWKDWVEMGSRLSVYNPFSCILYFSVGQFSCAISWYVL